MKKYAQNLILLIAAVTVFFTGAGVTIVNYCCTSCSGQTLFMAEQHICYAEQQETENINSCCAEKSSHDTCDEYAYTKDTHCTASRLSMDIDASSFRPQVAIPFVWISDVSVTMPLAILSEKTANSDDYTLFKSPPNILPREYLSLIRVLII